MVIPHSISEWDKYHTERELNLNGNRRQGAVKQETHGSQKQSTGGCLKYESNGELSSCAAFSLGLSITRYI